MSRYQALILDCLRRGGGHLTAEQVFLLAREEAPTIALATVYNNLNRLCQECALRRLTIAGQTDRYDLLTRTHGHLICDRCGRIGDVVLPGLLGRLSAEVGEPLASYELNLHYLCPACRQGEKEART